LPTQNVNYPSVVPISNTLQRSSHSWSLGGDDPTGLAGFKIVLREESGLPGGVPHEDAPLLGRLDKGLVVAADPVPDGDEVELGRVEDVTVLRRELEEPVRQSVVVLLLLDGVVEGRVAEVFLPVRYEELFELRDGKRRNC